MEEVIGSLVKDNRYREWLRSDKRHIFAYCLSFLFRDKEWLRLGKKEEEHSNPVSYVDIRTDGSGLRIHRPYELSDSKQDPAKYQELIKKTGMESPQKLIESSKRVYEKLKAGNYEDYDRIVEIVGVPTAAALIAGGGLMEYFAFNPLPLSTLSARGGGLGIAYGSLALRKFMKHIKSFNKEEVKKILKEEGIPCKRILRYDSELDELEIEI